MFGSNSEKSTDLEVKPAMDVKPASDPAGSSLGAKDVEAGATADLRRDLHAYHLQFLAIGGTIGTGLFIGTAASLAKAGPVGILIAFIFVGTIVWSVMVALGEMASYIPVAGCFTAYGSRFVDPSLGFGMGWIYWFSWAITFALELTTSGIIINYWNSSLNVGIFIAIFWVVFTGVNLLPVKWFGELEVYLSSIKVVTIVGFVIFAICVNAGAGSQGYIGFSYWKDPGPFNEYLVPGAIGKFVGFWAVLVSAGFSYQGAELVGVGAGETANPAKAVPTAIRWTFWGIFSLFVSTVFFIGILIPTSNSDLQNQIDNSGSDAASSPLVIACNLAGVKVLPDIINAVLLTAVLSAAQSNVYSGSRIVVALAEEGHAPKFMAKTNRHGTPYNAVALTSVFGLLAFLNESSSGTTVFNWFMNITSIAGFISWTCILICHIRFMSAAKFHGVARETLPYPAPLQPWASYYGLFFCCLIIITSGFTVFIEWSTVGFFTQYLSLIIFVILYIGHKLILRTKPIRLEDVDIVRGRVEHTAE